jgi:hypothetical protein
LNEQLWYVHIEGMDDFVATMSREGAEREASAINACLDNVENKAPAGVVRASATVWPFMAASHMGDRWKSTGTICSVCRVDEETVFVTKVSCRSRPCENACRTWHSKKSTLQIASYRLGSTSGRVKRHPETEYFCFFTRPRSYDDGSKRPFAVREAETNPRDASMRVRLPLNAVNRHACRNIV